MFSLPLPKNAIGPECGFSLARPKAKHIPLTGCPPNDTLSTTEVCIAEISACRSNIGCFVRALVHAAQGKMSLQPRGPSRLESRTRHIIHLLRSQWRLRDCAACSSSLLTCCSGYRLLRRRSLVALQSARQSLNRRCRSIPRYCRIPPSIQHPGYPSRSAMRRRVSILSQPFCGRQHSDQTAARALHR